uniref:FAM124 domain-containing protein n=1 Tax=Mola mola TaxID=94237 RepID=A0A3Q3XHX5_MOLML
AFVNAGEKDRSDSGLTPSGLSMGELQDPFLVSVHLIVDPGEGKFLQRAPALAVILFLQEAYGGEEDILMLHRALQRPPWRYHHTEKVSNGRRMLPLTPCSQDFFTLSPGTPLWAVRQVHYGKEIVRFTVYCQHENYVDMVRLYKLLLQRRVAQKKEDFCFFVVYSNPDMEIQLSFKRLPRGQSPLVLESAVMEVRVRDVGALVPLLPHPCSPISEVRWRTEDYEGNKILLQAVCDEFCLTIDRFFTCFFDTTIVLLSLLCLVLGVDFPGFSIENTCLLWLNMTLSHSLHRSPSLIPPFRLNVDALIGAEETDVDTGDKVNPGSSVDLSVVSAYIKSSLPQTYRPLSAPSEEMGPSFSPGIPENGHNAATLGRTPASFTTNTPSNLLGLRIQSPGANTSAAPSLSDVSSVISATIEEADRLEEEEDQEFYI